MIKNKTILSLFLFCSLCAGPALADSLSISFNDYSAAIGVHHPVSGDVNGFSEINFRGVYNKDEETTLGSLGLDVFGNVQNMLDGVHFGAGAKLYGGKADNGDIISLTLGGLMRLAPESWNGLQFSASYFYGPKIFSTLDAERLSDFQANVGYSFSQNASVYLEYANTRANLEDVGRQTIDEGIRLGITLSY